MFAAIAVINKPIASRLPSSNENLSAWTCRVAGQGVKDAETELWICMDGGWQLVVDACSRQSSHIQC